MKYSWIFLLFIFDAFFYDHFILKTLLSFLSKKTSKISNINVFAFRAFIQAIDQKRLKKNKNKVFCVSFLFIFMFFYEGLLSCYLFIKIIFKTNLNRWHLQNKISKPINSAHFFSLKLAISYFIVSFYDWNRICSQFKWDSPKA